MKRALLIFFVLVAAVGTCFATSGDKLVLKTSITAVSPNFEMTGTTTTDEGSVTETATQVGKELKILSPAHSDVSVQIVVKQSTPARFKGTYTLTIRASEIANTDTVNFGDQKTALPKVDGEVSIASATNDAVAVESSGTNEEVTLTVKYLTGVRVDSFDVASWTFKWDKVESLAAGDYSGEIVLTYTAS